VKVVLNGRGGKVGRVLGPALEAGGHELVELDAAEAMVDFTVPDAVEGNVRAALERGVPCVIGTSGFDQRAVDAMAREHGIACFYGPNFALGAVLMMRFAREAVEHLPHAEIIELHGQAKKDAPSGTAKATAATMGTDPPIHSVRLPGLVAHQEVVFGTEGQMLTIRHDTLSREAFVPGVLLALEKLPGLPPGLTVGLEELM
jgi:4-hydroxy-tetrahydrodipicolinate reductase